MHKIGTPWLLPCSCVPHCPPVVPSRTEPSCPWQDLLTYPVPASLPFLSPFLTLTCASWDHLPSSGIISPIPNTCSQMLSQSLRLRAPNPSHLVPHCLPEESGDPSVQPSEKSFPRAFIRCSKKAGDRLQNPLRSPLLHYRWPMTAQRPARRVKRRRTTRVTVRTRRGRPSSSNPGPGQEGVRMLWRKRTQLRNLFCAPVNKCCSPVCAVSVCCQLS